MKTIRSVTVLATAAILTSLAAAHAQEVTVNPGDVRVKSPDAAVAALPPQVTVSAPGPKLTVWPYSIAVPPLRGGGTVTGTVVGGNPGNNGARTTHIPVVIIPLRIQFTGTVRNFDPTSPDDGCLGAGNTAVSLTQASPIFQPVSNYMFNGVNMGNVTYPDAFQRASFYPLVANKPAYHLALDVSVAAKQTISVVNGTSNGTTLGATGSCSTNSAAADNPAGRLGVININYLDPLLNNIIASLGINHSQFPLFIIYGTVISDGDARNLGNCCILGYHNGSGVPSDPGQTYGIAEYDQSYIFADGFGNVVVKDISVLSHEVMEWVNDPSVNNLVPAWGHLGQVGGCQDNLETGDPLSGTLDPPVVLGSVTYHTQEQAFFGWFTGAQPAPGAASGAGAGGKFSSNGTFGGFAKLCPPGGTF